MRAFLREILAIIIVAVVIFILLQTTIQSFEVYGDCMEPNFEEGQRLIINKAVYRFREPQRGEVIILHPPPSTHQSTPFIKRIIAVPGDTIEIEEGVVYVNSSPLDEPYIKEPPSYTIKRQKIPDNEYFVLGDNRNVAYDSHRWGTLPRQNIIGKAWLSIWPPSEWGLVAHYPLQEQLPSTKLLPQLP
ncbi:MAG: signal peptidase I [Dehalococcoidia bacterium]|nr:MAG: signal peptidase I [Dehalococcoidia bacterium]